jgi:glutamine amidotransferase
MANLRSVEKALARVGGDPLITSDPEMVAQADQVVLPGVGAFCAAMTNLNRSGLRNAVLHSIASGKPFLGICLGLQMLFQSSTEMGDSEGLCVFPGRVVTFFAADREEVALRSPGLKVPHIGWNGLTLRGSSRLLRGLDEGAMVYFVHSYFPQPADPAIITATCDHGGDFCCAVEQGNIAATQFHPEKSGAVGLQILRNFVTWE